jgi:hypothetical protein
MPLLLKLGLGLLGVALIGAFVAWWLWPPKPPVPPKVVSFTVDPATVPANGQAQLCYEVENASSVRIEPNIGERKPATKECLPVSAEQTTTYTLTALGSDGKTTSQQQVTLIVDVPPLAKIVRFEALREHGPGGENDVQFRLCYEVRNAEHAEIDNDGGAVILDEPRCQQVTPERTTTYTLTAAGSDGRTISRQVTVDVTKPPPPPPQVLNFSALPPNIMAGEKAQLCFQLKDASSVQIDSGVPHLEAGTERQCVTVAPIKTTTYTLTASNSEGKTSIKKATIVVPPPSPKIISFTARPDTVVGRGQVQLCYEVKDATRVHIDHNVGTVGSTGSGCADFSVTENTTFTLTATGPNGKVATSRVNVKVERKPVEIVEFTASPDNPTSGSQVTLCWSTRNANRVVIDHGVGDFGVEGDLQRCSQVSISQTTTYTATAFGTFGGRATRQVTVRVKEPARKPARILFFRASEARIKAGASVNLCYGVADTIGARIATPVPRKVDPVENNCIDLSPPASVTYVLSAVGEDGEVVSQEVRVEVEPNRIPSVRITRFEINPTMLHGTQLCYAVENARSARIDPEFGELRKLPADCPKLRSLEPRTYTLIATGQDGKTDRRSVSYTPPEPPKPIAIKITSFSPATQTINAGAAAKICYSTFGEGTAQISPQPGSVPPSLFKRCVSVSPQETTVYTLTVTVTGPENQEDSRRVTVKVQRPGIVIQ